MSDYVLKAKVLNSGLCSKVKLLDKEIYEAIGNGDYDITGHEFSFMLDNDCSLADIDEARRVNQSNYKRVKRLNERIQDYLLQGCCIWLTLTFNEDTLAKTSEETRRKYVRRFLKSQSNYYLANIDYGKTTEREHYHAVVVGDFVDMKQWKYGFAYTERIKNHTTSSIKISKYVSKLTNHAIKETTKRSVYIYSR